MLVLSKLMNHLLLAKFHSELLDPSFLFALDNGEKYSVQPMRFAALFKMTRVKVNHGFMRVCVVLVVMIVVTAFLSIFIV